MCQWITIYFCASYENIYAFIFKVYPNNLSYHQYFLRKKFWKLFDPFITFSPQMWRIDYIPKPFSVFLWSFLLGCPFRKPALPWWLTYFTPLVLWERFVGQVNHHGNILQAKEVQIIFFQWKLRSLRCYFFQIWNLGSRLYFGLKLLYFFEIIEKFQNFKLK